ncbi:MAG TPA: hypothetical protein ENI23_14965 [bacterium]|nr:hypothetical protein [bacterium]
MSKSLIKLIDSSLLPAAIMILGKVVGIFLTARIFNLEWALQSSSNNFISIRPVFEAADIVTVTTFSDLIMFSFLLVGLSFSLFIALYFRSSNIDPKIVAKLATNNLLNLIKDSFDIYLGGSMWIVFSWIANITIFINVMLNKTQLWVIVLTLVSSIAFTVLLFRDVVKEIEVSRKKLSEV